MEYDDVVDPVQELGPEGLLEAVINRVPEPLFIHVRVLAIGAEAKGLALQRLGAQIAGHYDHGVAEINGAAVSVGQASVLQDLQQNVEHVRMGLFDLVEEDHAVGPPSHRFG